jgi:predicted secreted protein
MAQQDHFNEAVRLGRLIRGKSHRELSDATGIPVWRLRAFERGESHVRASEFVRLWAYLAHDERAMAATASQGSEPDAR